MVVEPVRIVRGHIDAAVAAIAGKGFIAAAVIVGEVGTNAIVGTPPAVMKEVAPIVVFHGVLNLCRGIPESRSLGLARFELCRMLA